MSTVDKTNALAYNNAQDFKHPHYSGKPIRQPMAFFISILNHILWFDILSNVLVYAWGRANTIAVRRISSAVYSQCLNPQAPYFKRMEKSNKSTIGIQS